MCGSDFDGREKEFEVVDAETKEVLGVPYGHVIESDRDGYYGGAPGGTFLAVKSEYTGKWSEGYSGETGVRTAFIRKADQQS